MFTRKYFSRINFKKSHTKVHTKKTLDYSTQFPPQSNGNFQLSSTGHMLASVKKQLNCRTRAKNKNKLHHTQKQTNQHKREPKFFEMCVIIIIASQQ